MKFLFITTHSLATNPRVYKEIISVREAGNKVEVICFEFDNWSKQLNEKLKKDLNGINIISIPAGRRHLLPWFRSVLTERLYRTLGKFFPLPASLLAQAVSRRNLLLIKALKKVSAADWVIGHNPGALYATLAAGEKFVCKTGFDVEDYHPGEGNNVFLQRLTKTLMKKTIPHFTYTSYASPMIKDYAEKDLAVKPAVGLTVMNYFPATEFREPIKIYGPLRMVWFSQYISYGRGLELILPFLENSESTVELHLFGNMDDNFHRDHIKGAKNIFIYPPVEQKKLHWQLATFDLGLALEPAKDMNNELAISNKILAYLQSGLFVLATNTEAQKRLLADYPEHGCCFDHLVNDSKIVLERLIAQID